MINIALGAETVYLLGRVGCSTGTARGVELLVQLITARVHAGKNLVEIDVLA